MKGVMSEVFWHSPILSGSGDAVGGKKFGGLGLKMSRFTNGVGDHQKVRYKWDLLKWHLIQTMDTIFRNKIHQNGFWYIILLLVWSSQNRFQMIWSLKNPVYDHWKLETLEFSIGFRIRYVQSHLWVGGTSFWGLPASVSWLDSKVQFLTGVTLNKWEGKRQAILDRKLHNLQLAHHWHVCLIQKKLHHLQLPLAKLKKTFHFIQWECCIPLVYMDDG